MRVFSVFLAVILFSCATREKKENLHFVKIPAGTYTLGDSMSRNNPLHTVATPEYYISTTEITNEEFSSFVKATGYKTTAEKYKNAMTFYPGLDEYEWVHDTSANWRFPFGRKKGGIEKKMNHPVTCISYVDAQAYCKWKKVRLPTLDEWEIACRAGTRTRHFCGRDNKKVTDYGNIWLSKTHAELTVKDEFLYTSPVGIFKPNAWGLYDVYGNCFEFCSTKTAHLQNVKNVVCARGGSWWCSRNSCNYFNSVDIGRVDRFASFSNHGFRIVKDSL